MHNGDHYIPSLTHLGVVWFPPHRTSLIRSVLPLRPESLPNPLILIVIRAIYNIVPSTWRLSDPIRLGPQIFIVPKHFKILKLFSSSRVPSDFLIATTLVWELGIEPRIMVLQTPVRLSLKKGIHIWEERNRWIDHRVVPFCPVYFVLLRILWKIRVHSESWPSTFGPKHHSAFLLAVWEVKLTESPYIFTDVILWALRVFRDACNGMSEDFVWIQVCAEVRASPVIRLIEALNHIWHSVLAKFMPIL
jgi:hypothetical protein